MNTIFSNQIKTEITDKSLAILVDDRLVAVVPKTTADKTLIYDTLENMGYEINEDNYTISSLLPTEEKYVFNQIQQIKMQTGYIGCLEGNFNSNSRKFMTTWKEDGPLTNALKTPQFKNDLDFIISELTSKDAFLNNKSNLINLCQIHPEWKLSNNNNSSGISVSTKEHLFLFRVDTMPGDYNVYCYCYNKRWFDSHISLAQKGIRFITPDYKQKFYIADGEKIRITDKDGNYVDKTCRFIDDYHFEMDMNIYHICQFAEIMNKHKNTVEPLQKNVDHKEKTNNHRNKDVR